jgi:hypothetical protein
MIQRIQIQDIPTVILYNGKLETATQKGCILCYHGLTSSKDDWLNDLELIAKKGFVVVGVDNVGHGEQKTQTFSKNIRETILTSGRTLLQLFKLPLLKPQCLLTNS